MKAKITKHKITLVKLGHVDRIVEFKRILKWKSKLFEINSNKCICYLPESDVVDGYLDIKYTNEKLSNIISCPEDSDYCIAIMPYRFNDGFYMHRIGVNCAVLSLYGIANILRTENISIENFIINQLYCTCAIKNLLTDFSSSEASKLKHRDTRGCLFDMNGDRNDLIYNIEKPVICDCCKSKFKNNQMNTDTLSTFEKELKRIRKPWILRAERKIKEYPLISIILSVLSAIFITVIANLICK